MEQETSSSSHLTPQEIDSYRERRLVPERLFLVYEHLMKCVDCYAQLQITADVSRTTQMAAVSLFAGFEEECDFLTWEQKTAYVEQTGSETEQYWVENHLDICAECHNEIHELRMLQAQISAAKAIVPPAIAATAPAPVSAGWWTSVCSFWAKPQWRIPVQLGATAMLMLGSAWLTNQFLQGKIAQLQQQVTNQAVQQQRDTEAAARIAELEQQLATLQASQAPPTTGSPAPKDLAEVILKDGDKQITLNAAGEITGIPLPRDYEEEIKQALLKQKLTRPRGLQGLSGPSGMLMGSTATSLGFVVLGPFKKNVATAQPIFRWRPLTGATGYVVTVYEAKANAKEVITSELLTTTEWVVPHSLPRGSVYMWQVRAYQDGKETVAPGPNLPDAKFGILAQKQWEEVEQLTRQYADSRLLKGIIYTRYGLLDEAETEFQAFQTANPNAPIAKRLLRAIKQFR